MDFGSLLHHAQKNDKTNKNGVNYYKTKFEPPKKENKSKTLSANIQKFLAKKEEEEKRKAEESKKKRDELLAMRDVKATNKIKKMLKVIKSANKSVLDDAVDNNDTAVTMAGPDQPDEDDYGYVSQEASAYYSKMMEKYKSIPDEEKFKSATKTVNYDLSSTKDRVRAAIIRHQEEEMMPHKRKRKSRNPDDSIGSPNDYDDQPDEPEKPAKEEKPKPRRPAPPPLDFNELLKIAEKKQFEPVVIETKKPEKVEEPERLMTKKQKREQEQYRAYREAKAKREQERNSATDKELVRKPKVDTSSTTHQEKVSNPLSIRIPKIGEKKQTSDEGKKNNVPNDSMQRHIPADKERTSNKSLFETKDRNEGKSNERRTSEYSTNKNVSKTVSNNSSSSYKANVSKESTQRDDRGKVNQSDKRPSSSSSSSSQRSNLFSSKPNPSSNSKESSLESLNYKKSKPEVPHRQDRTSEHRKQNHLDNSKVDKQRIEQSTKRDQSLDNRNIKIEKKSDLFKQGAKLSSSDKIPSRDQSSSKSVPMKGDRMSTDSRVLKKYIESKGTKPSNSPNSDASRTKLPLTQENKNKSMSTSNTKGERQTMSSSAETKGGKTPQANTKGGRPVPPTDKGGRPIPPNIKNERPFPPPSGRPLPSSNIKGGRPMPPSDGKGGRSDVKGGRPLPPPDMKGGRPFPPSDMKSGRPFPPSDVKGGRPFPPPDVKGGRPFPPNDIKGSRQFPPSDVKGARQFPPRDMMAKKDKMRPNKRRILDDDSEYDSELDDFIDDDPQDNKDDYSKYIKEIFGYDKSRYKDIDEDDDNMESNYSQVMREEYISKKIGIMEDLEDMRMEAMEKKKKMQNKRRRIDDDDD